MMYPEVMVAPMREELSRAGIQETRTAEEVDRVVTQKGTTMIVVNSVCGCAAGKMRPGVQEAMGNDIIPDHCITVFAGQDSEATARARSYFAGFPPSSPSIGILQDGKLVYMMQRSDIEVREASAIATELSAAFNKYCRKPAAV